MIIGGVSVEKGERKHIDINIARLYDSTEMALSIEVVRGSEDGPILFLSSATHGDELNGTETIRRLLSMPMINTIKGTIIAAPIVNAYGFNTKSRYLPDRRDLNRSFPGSPEGSLAARLAHVFVTEIVNQSTHGIDFHTGAINRSNLPQIRAKMDSDVVRKMADDFCAPVTMNDDLRDGSLREYCYQNNIPILVYEGGEALRYSEKAITCALDGTINVMAGLGMIHTRERLENAQQTINIASGSYWIRAPHSGLLVSDKLLSDVVEEGEQLGLITDAFNTIRHPIIAPYGGIIIGATTTPLLNEGDATYHIAHYDGDVDVTVA